MPCEMVSLAFDANFTTKLKERVIHEGLKKKKKKKKANLQKNQSGAERRQKAT